MKRSIRQMTDHRRWLAGVIALAGLAVAAPCAQAQIFVTNATGTNSGGVSEYDLSGNLLNTSLISTQNIIAPSLAVSGSDVFVPENTASANSVGEYTLGAAPGTLASSNPSFLTGLSFPKSVAVSGPDLFVGSIGTVGEYTTAGTPVNASLLTGLGSSANFVVGVAVSGSDLFVALASTEGQENGKVSEYTLGSTPGTIASSNLSFITGDDPTAIAVSGSDLFVLDPLTQTISEYTTSGTLVNASLVSGLNPATGIAVSGSDLFVALGAAKGGGSARISEYTLGSTPGTIASSDPTFISGLAGPSGLAVEAQSEVQAAPEPSTWALLLAGLGALAFWRRRITRRAVRA